MCGTPHYIAPEVILGMGHDKMVDFWSLGVMIYEMLAGRPPFSGENKLDLFKRIVSGERVAMPSHFRPLARDLIGKLLVVNPAERLGFGGVEEVMRHPWFEGIDWDALYHGRLPVPFNPGVSEEGDASCYARYGDVDGCEGEGGGGEEEGFGGGGYYADDIGRPTRGMGGVRRWDADDAGGDDGGGVWDRSPPGAGARQPRLGGASPALVVTSPSTAAGAAPVRRHQVTTTTTATATTTELLFQGF